MKNYQKTVGIFLLAIMMTGVLTLGGCEKNDTEVLKVSDQAILGTSSMDEMSKITVIKDPEVLAEIDWLWRNHYIQSKSVFCNLHRDGINFTSLPDGDFLYNIPNFNNSDLLVTRQFVNQQLTIERKSKSARHYRYSNMFSGGTVTIRIHDNVPLLWRTAIQNACIAWNNLGRNITMISYVSPNNLFVAGEVDVHLTNLGATQTNTIAATTNTKSGSGGVSETTYINSGGNIYNSIWQSARQMNMAHELGHAIGLGHTDFVDSGYSQVSSTIACKGTVNYTDPSSIMRVSIPYNQAWTAFTTCDQNVIQAYWGSIA